VSGQVVGGQDVGATGGARRVDLGHGLEVSRLGFGGMAITHVYGETDPAEGLRTLHHAVDAGVTFIDTADVYGQPREGVEGPAGTNEELVAQLLRDRRDEVQLATKFGITGVPNQGPGATGVRGDAAYVRSAAEASLRRLGTDVIDLYYLHRRDVSVPIEETVGAMAELVAAGKVRYLGLSEVTATELRAAAAVHAISAVQSEWSIWSRDVEAQVVPAAVEVGAIGWRFGLACVGCCWALMLLTFTVGVGAMPVMVAVSAVMLAERLLPRTRRLVPAVALGCIALGLLILVGVVPPGLH